MFLTFTSNMGDTISNNSEMLYYLSKKATKLKTSTKFRGHEFTEVGWNPMNTSESTTGSILLGKI